MMKRPKPLRLNNHPSHPQSQGITTFGDYTVSIVAITLIGRLDVSMGQRFEPEQSHHGGATRLLGKGLPFASDPSNNHQHLKPEEVETGDACPFSMGEGESRARPRGFHGPRGME